MIRSEGFLAHVRTFPCAVDDKKCWGDVIPHHCETYGVGIKCDDTRTVSLCVGHHDEYHSKGKKTFAKKYPGAIANRRVEILTSYLEDMIRAKWEDLEQDRLDIEEDLQDES